MKTTRAAVVLEVCANRRIESALMSRKDVLVPPAPTMPPGRPARRNNTNESLITSMPTPANPLAGWSS